MPASRTWKGLFADSEWEGAFGMRRFALLLLRARDSPTYVPVSIHQLIVAINPDVFCERSVRREVKRILHVAGANAEPTPSAPQQEDTNPFSALFSFGDWFKPAESTVGVPVSKGPLRPDSEVEAVLRSRVLLEARKACREFYEHGKRRLHLPLWSDA